MPSRIDWTTLDPNKGLRRRRLEIWLVGFADAGLAGDAVGDYGADAGLLHGDAEPGGGGFDGGGVVRDYDELRVLGAVFEHLDVALHVAAVERRVELIEDAEGAGLDFEQREEERACRQRALAAGEELEALGFFAGDADVDLDAGFEHVVGVGEFEGCLAAAEELLESFLEGLVDLVEGFGEGASGEFVEFGDGFVE